MPRRRRTHPPRRRRRGRRNAARASCSGSLGDVHWTTSAEQALEIVERPRLGPDGQRHRPARDRRTRAGAPVKRQRPQLATLILSGHSSFDHAVAAMRAGADDYLTKPFDPAGADREGARARRRHARAPRGRAGRRARGRRASRRRRDRHRRHPAAPRRPGSSRHAPDAHRRRGRAARRPTARPSREKAAELMSARLIHAALDRHQRQRGRLDDRHDPRRRRGDPADDDLHAHDPRRPPGPPQRAQRDAGRRPRHLARVLLPGAVHHASSSSRRASWPSTSSSSARSRSSAPSRRRSSIRELPRRGAAARDRPLLGALQPGALRRAARGRARQRRRAVRPPPRGGARCRLNLRACS